MRSSEEKCALCLGTLFQVPMIGIFIATTVLYNGQAAWNSPWRSLDYAGCLLFLYCLARLYLFQSGKAKKLLTTGPFKYTRHPMYTGLLLMDTMFWLPRLASHELLFFFLQATFITCLVVAAYFQEKETLARFGTEAKTYYAKTPRLFLMYPFMCRQSQLV